MMSVGTKKRGLVVAAALLCALVVSQAPAAADEPEVPGVLSGTSFPEIHGPTDPERYVGELHLGQEQVARQVDEHEVVVEYEEGPVAFRIHDPGAHDSFGATVPTTFSLSEGDVLTLTVHHREGNPTAGGAPFVYPISGGKGWEGGFFSEGFEMNEPQPPTAAAPPPPAPAAPICTVPSLHNLSLRAAKSHLRAANCAIGQVHLAADATAAKGKVVKQFRAAGIELPAGAPVGVKLGPRQPS